MIATNKRPVLKEVSIRSSYHLPLEPWTIQNSFRLSDLYFEVWCKSGCGELGTWSFMPVAIFRVLVH